MQAFFERLAAVSSALIILLIAGGISAQESSETISEQVAAELAEADPRASSLPGQAFGGGGGPLLVGVDDAAIGAFRIDVVGDIATQAFTGAQVWGAAYDAANDRVLFNNGSELLEWPVGGVVNSLGPITDPGMTVLSMTGLAFGNDTLYACRNIANEAIYAVDVNTRVATVFIDYDDTEFDCGGLAFNPDDGFLYMTDDATAGLGRGLFRMNMDGTGTLITAYPAGQTDIDGLAIGNGRAYLIIDEPGDLFVWDFALAAYQTPLTSPFATAETFSSGAWIGSGGPGVFEADLAITKTDGVASVTAGTDTIYTIVASNVGPSDAPASTVVDTFPAACVGVTWTCAGAAGGTCTANGAGNINDVVNLPAGASVTYNATCPIDPAAAVGTLDNTATVAVGAGVTDPNAANNSATDSDTLAASADVGVGKVATTVPVPLLVGSNIVYELTASNAGPSVATGVVVTDNLPSQLDFVSNDCGASFVDPTLTWNVGTLAPGASAVCTLTVQVAVTGSITNTATIASATTDPTPGNNSASAVVGGAELADLAIGLTANAPGALALGDGFVYTVTGTNGGPGTAIDVDFSLDLPINVDVLSNDCGALPAGSTLNWNVASLASGAAASCEITVLVALPGDILATAAVVSASLDPDPTNNSTELLLSAQTVPVPANTPIGLIVLAMLSLVIGLIVLRRG